ncbi:hypothetical protein BMF77_02666 [Dolichospermum sp. UHCC 0315A]|jgi:ABC-type Fe3+/spermidine/putrescine transport system ATPase subunit|uniref:hypothetical protein n=1 Tax=Dolichospermum lemmermannii TaxID=54295 RepID=UPI0011E7A8E0|nr:hypothetical protein [Dolichospermum lemmermannii]MDB9438016.1 hypothetical protein [Dolichospermum lemmermannii CS-548]QEI42061.1 hypothetical protein BMF77_02666 [Dolichospermum sp. UHCC 0315A]
MMPQNTEYSQLPHFKVSGNLKLILEVDLRLTKQTLPKEYLIPAGIAYHLNGGSTRGKWTSQRVNKMLEVMKYQQRHYWQWEPTIQGQQFADFSSRDLKWSPEVINLILQQQPQQLRLAV